MSGLYLGVLCSSLSALLFEISLTKLFSVILWYHFAYLVVSLALFGIGAGGLITFFFENYLKKNITQVLPRMAILQFVGIISCLAFILNFKITAGFHKATLLRTILLYISCSFPFMISGATTSLTMRVYGEKIPKIYFFDLIGAAMGCIVLVVAITYFSAPAVVIIAGFFALAAFLCFSFFLRLLSVPTAFIVMMMATGVIYTHTQTDIFSIKYTKLYRERKDLMYEKWSPLARITVYPGIFWAKDVNAPFGWGMSKKFVSKGPIKQLWIEQDGCAGTPITQFDGDFRKLDFLRYDVTAFAYYLKDKPTTCVIGSGGGRDILTALLFGAPKVTACEINPVIVNLLRNQYRSFSGNLYDLAQVQVKVAEARNYIRSSQEHFDIIQMSLIDSWAATVAGALSLSENSLYTVEAFVDYLRHLKPDGVLSITRFLSMPRSQCLRVAVIARKALENTGIQYPWQHIAVVATHPYQGLATVIIKKSPFTPPEIKTIQDAAGQLNFSVLYLPDQCQDAAFCMAMTEPLKNIIEKSYYDVRPVTDDRPFFFQFLYFSKIFDLFTGKALHGQHMNYYAQLVIAILLIISSILILSFYIVPLMISRKTGTMSRPWSLYFMLLGLGFMFVEIPLLQKGSLYLGHPTYSISVVLFAMLIFSGLGSYYSGSIDIKNLPRFLFYFLCWTTITLTVVTFCLEYIVSWTIGFMPPLKIFIFMCCTGLMAFFMGTAFPSGMRLLNHSHPTHIPWAWALNAGASVLGSVIAMGISINFGYRYVLWCGVWAYLLAGVLVRYLMTIKKQHS
ncbi:MAG: hypothetical protein WCI77_00755 [Candidatus Omnitrophota bacterium]